VALLGSWIRYDPGSADADDNANEEFHRTISFPGKSLQRVPSREKGFNVSQRHKVHAAAQKVTARFKVENMEKPREQKCPPHSGVEAVRADD
jgi:hypothetical protein